MSARSKSVEEFVAVVRRRKNRHHLCTTLLWAVTAAAALVVAVGLCYVARGYAVPAAWIAAVVAAVSLAAASLWALRRHSVESASRFADRFFNLQDTVTSYLHFAAHGFRDGYYALQAQQAVDRVAALDAAAVRYRPRKRLLFAAALLVAAAIPISLCSPSDEVLGRLAMEQLIEKNTAAMNADLVKQAEKLIEETRSKEELKLLQPDKLRRWVEELKTTKDRTEALRQYARLEAQAQQGEGIVATQE